MTGAAVMTPLTPDAARRLDRYVADVRAALAQAPDVSPDEIEADVRAHVDAEFAAAVRPVTAVELEAVLVRLGPPSAWAAAADGPPAPPGAVEPFDFGRLFAGVRRRALSVFQTLWRGPEDWRLVYVGFGLFVLGLLTLPLFGFGVLLLGMSYLFGRAAGELAKEKGQPLGARRWLAYPGVLAFAVPLFLAFTLWPLVAAPAGAHAVSDAQRNVRYADEVIPSPRGRYVPPPEQVAADKRFLKAIPVTGDFAEALAGVFAGAGAISAWWTVLGLLMWAFPKWPGAVFHPLLDGYDGGHGLKLAGFAGLAFFLWCGVAFRFAEIAWG